MAKIKRKVVTVEARHHMFDQRYDEAMEQFDDVDVINIHVASKSREFDMITEQYLVFYREIDTVEADVD